MNKSSVKPFFQLTGIGFSAPAHNGNAVPIIKGVNIKIKEGEWVSFVGRNGSGKTTLSRLLCGLLSASAGEILVEGRRIDELKKKGELYETVGYLFSDPENQIVYPVVEDDVAFGPTNLGFLPPEVKKRVDESLGMAGLEGYRKRSVALLSSGEMKKVALAGVLAMNPKAIVFDEPFLMLDSKGAIELVDILKKLRGRGITLVSTTSSLEEAATSDRVFILKDGEIILEGEFKEILSERDIIEDAGLDLPKMTQLIYHLREKGMPIPVETFGVEGIARLLLDSKSSPESD